MPGRTMLVRLLTVVGVLLAAVGLTAAPASAAAHGTVAKPGQDPFAVKLTMTHIPRRG